MKARTLQDYKAQQMKTPGFKKAWRELDAEFELLESMLALRERAGMSQQRLAEMIGTQQPALSRLERGGFKKASMATLSKIADALDARLVIRLEPRR
ncbi:MAG: helix-turn-helix transcriptional regulator [Deltaproteobacteria bacterium]|nr:helix-turn-helix transcriptional regulator [Deltaproteobacteria bacterium]